MFVNYLLDLIAKKPKQDAITIKNEGVLSDDQDLPFRHYFISGQDEIIYKILYNYFSAAKAVFLKEWNDPNEYILTRTTGFGALMLALKDISKEGLLNKDLTYDYFERIFNRFRKILKTETKELVARQFPSGVAMQRRLKDILINQCL